MTEPASLGLWLMSKEKRDYTIGRQAGKDYNKRIYEIYWLMNKIWPTLLELDHIIKAMKLTQS